MLHLIVGAPESRWKDSGTVPLKNDFVCALTHWMILILVKEERRGIRNEIKIMKKILKQKTFSLTPPQTVAPSTLLVTPPSSSL